MNTQRQEEIEIKKAFAETFIYDSHTGEIYRAIGDDVWRARGRPSFQSRCGVHLCGTFKGKSYAAHRVAWLLHYGDWPKGQIDHINGDPTDNRIRNLRDVSNLENCRNLGRRKTRNPSTDSGVNGVYWHKQSRKWMARLKNNGKWIYLGTYADLKDAVEVRRRAEVAYGFHPNHGRRAAVSRKKTRQSLLD